MTRLNLDPSASLRFIEAAIGSFLEYTSSGMYSLADIAPALSVAAPFLAPIPFLADVVLADFDPPGLLSVSEMVPFGTTDNLFLNPAFYVEFNPFVGVTASASTLSLSSYSLASSCSITILWITDYISILYCFLNYSICFPTSAFTLLSIISYISGVICISDIFFR